MIKAITEKIQIPIKPDGTYDLEKQQSLAQKYATIESIKESIQKQIDTITTVTIV